MPRIVLPREVLASDPLWRSAGSEHRRTDLAVELPDRRANRTLLVFAFVEGCRHLPAEAGEIGTRQLVALRRRIFEGINGLALALHFEMQVRTGRAAGVAGEADQITLQHHRPGHDAGREAAEMAIDRAELSCPLAIAVIDADCVAVALIAPGQCDHAVGCRVDPRADQRHKVDAVMHVEPARAVPLSARASRWAAMAEGIGAHAKTRSDAHDVERQADRRRGSGLSIGQ